LLAPRNAAREILSDSDAERMLSSGSWVIAKIPKKQSAGARNQKNYMRRRLEAGYRKLEVLLPAHVYRALHVRQQDGESMAMVVERLLAESSVDNDKEGQSGGQK
jgi:hypothetical protein